MPLEYYNNYKWVFTSCVSEKGQSEVAKQPLEVGIVMETGTISEDLDSGELCDLVECAGLSSFSETPRTESGKYNHLITVEVQ